MNVTPPQCSNRIIFHVTRMSCNSSLMYLLGTLQTSRMLNVIRCTSSLDLFQRVNGVRVWKMTEYCRESEIFIVYHLGMHTCSLKPNTNRYRNMVRKAVYRKWSLGACAIQNVEVGEAVTVGEI